MQAAIPFPDISPELFTISLFGIEFALRWYALAYIAGIIIAWRISLHALARPGLWQGNTPPMDRRQVEDLLTWIIIGIVLGGRLGFVLFYQPAYYLQNPAEILMVWQGGMAFHGGFLGVVVAGWLYTRAQGIPRLAAGDAIALGVPVGLMLGRIANFINGELWGRQTDLPWGVIFPQPMAQDCPGVVGLCARHPSQLYEAVLEGVVLLGLMLWLAYRRGALKVPGQVTGVFIAGYGAARFVVEYFRQADPQFITPDNPMGFVIGAGEVGLTMGQVLSLPMVVVGVALILYARGRVRASAET
ncbi:prolipoprotein diacylglyceryl transferase [Lacimonas salitolerans]|uniref:Phosphatidylglycerol--prolipoprotein diacylglyceryl transferase n=1 Tax=Lacimonas salitolerans TaxID=1323750 RepID=A0ABW4E9N1_9RHOB